jgi:hypothetical protein
LPTGISVRTLGWPPATRNQLLDIDPAKDQIVARIDVPGAKGNHGLLIDAEQRLAFIACEGNDRLIVLDMRTMRVASSFQVGRAKCKGRPSRPTLLTSA